MKKSERKRWLGIAAIEHARCRLEQSLYVAPLCAFCYYHELDADDGYNCTHPLEVVYDFTFERVLSDPPKGDCWAFRPECPWRESHKGYKSIWAFYSALYAVTVEEAELAADSEATRPYKAGF